MSEQEQYKYVNYISIPSHIPKVSYRYMPCGKSNKNRRLLVKYHSSDKELYLDDITKLKNDIINTKERYVYPTVYVNFAKKYVYNNDNIVFDNHKLFKLRIWSNQLRECFQNQKYNDVDYLAHYIGCKIIKYANQQKN